MNNSKYIKPALFLSTALLASTAQADFIGVNAEAGTFLVNSGDDANSYFGIAFEHPIPLIPNFRLQSQALEIDKKPDLSFNDYTAYYEFLDGLLWLSLDAGITIRDIGDSGNSKIDDIYPLTYISAYISIPGTALSFGGEVKTGTDISDTTFKIKFQPLIFAGIEAGYRTIEEDFGSAGTFEPDGAFVGVFLDF